MVADTLSRHSVEEFSEASQSLVVDDLLAPASASAPSVSALALCPGVDFAALAAAQASCPDLLAPSSLRPSKLQVPGAPCKLWCDVSQRSPRPLVPPSMRDAVFNCFHGLSHAGGRGTLRLVSARFVWPGMRSEILQRVRCCQHCISSKVTRHVKTAFVQRPIPDSRFSSLHVDLVGPLPSSEGFSYLMTIIDGYTRWMEAIPLKDISAASCAAVLLRHWICRFGVPADITSDQGAQFTSVLWSELHQALGISALRTTAYHPQANGMVERIPRVLKERLCARRAAPNWMDHLPVVLLGIRSSVREETGYSPADLVYGSPLRLPGEFVAAPEADSGIPAPTSVFVAQLRQTLAVQRPPQAHHHRRHGAPTVHLPDSLLRASHVYVRVDAVRRPLTRPYDGPYPVQQSGQKTFTVLRSGRPWVVSVDRLKEAVGFFSGDGPRRPSPAPVSAPAPALSLSPAPAPPVAAAARSSASSDRSYATVLRSGRVSRPPVRLDV